MKKGTPAVDMTRYLADGVTHGLQPQRVLPRWFLKNLVRAWHSGSARPYLLGEPCVYCGRVSDTIEHVVPQSTTFGGGKVGGSGHWGNKVGACKRCNNERGNKPFMVWMVRRHPRYIKPWRSWR